MGRYLRKIFVSQERRDRGDHRNQDDVGIVFVLEGESNSVLKGVRNESSVRHKESEQRFSLPTSPRLALRLSRACERSTLNVQHYVIGSPTEHEQLSGHSFLGNTSCRLAVSSASSHPFCENFSRLPD